MAILKDKINNLTAKYGIAVPRYTSYPTAPEWRDEYTSKAFEEAIQRSNQSKKDYSLYLHIPFCESQCYYCGCNVVISQQHGIEQKYIERLKEELKYLGSQIDKDRRVVQMAWGGGTPTYLAPEQIKEIYQCIQKNFRLIPKANTSDSFEYSIEIDPRVTSSEHLQTLYDLGFNRLSMGIQDFNYQTQETINRIQPYEMVEALTNQAREIGFKSINYDLIYGLPYQTLETFKETLKQVKQLDPERIALFNYAHIPSIFPFQQKYIPDESLPSQEEKLLIFDQAVQEFTEFGYEFIGIDHFAKPNDELAIAQRNKTIYRNFQGYTTYSGCDLFGAGITAISDVAGAYKQNYKKLNNYYESFGADKFKICNDDDIERRAIIKNIMCNYEAIVPEDKYQNVLETLAEFVNDELLVISSSFSEEESGRMSDLLALYEENEAKLIKIQVTELGKFFVRNIASKFDNYITKSDGHKLFSKAL